MNRLFSVLCFDYKPGKDRHAQTQTQRCLGLDKERSAITVNHGWSNAALICDNTASFTEIAVCSRVTKNIVLLKLFTIKVWQWFKERSAQYRLLFIQLSCRLACVNLFQLKRGITWQRLWLVECKNGNYFYTVYTAPAAQQQSSTSTPKHIQSLLKHMERDNCVAVWQTGSKRHLRLSFQ